MYYIKPSLVAQSVASLTAESRAASLSTARPHTFMEIDHEIIPTVILLLPLIQEEFSVSYKRKYVDEVLVNHLVKLAHLTISTGP